jgi:uncharacterized membrane protein
VIHTLVDATGSGLEALGVLLLALGTVVALMRAFAPAADTAARHQRLRHDLGRAILIGLEVLVAADIVRSVAVGPSMGGVATLAAIVAIRTFLSWSLSLELEGRWPWQSRRSHPAHPPHPDTP